MYIICNTWLVSDKTTAMDPLEVLNSDCQTHLFSYLDPNSIMAASLVSR